MILTNEVMHVAFFVLGVLGIQGKPSLSFNLAGIGHFGGFGISRDVKPALKVYSGKRVKNDSIRMVYYHDQTVAVVELEPSKLLLNCELIEILEPEQRTKSIGELNSVARPLQISFKEMITLMNQCKELEEDIEKVNNEEDKNQSHAMEGRGILASNPLSLLSGIIPGTKWCGTGDIAKDYHDLGVEPSVDSCCRAHDLCPVKIRAHSRRYNLTNQSLYTKSHCLCDDNLFDCLKSHPTPTANIMGNIYFNLVQVPCLEDTTKGIEFRTARSNF